MALAAAEAIRRAYRQACALDVNVLKPGNVSVMASGHGMSATDFLASAEVTAPVLTRADLNLGDAIRECARVTQLRAHCNTNLGIILLCVPLAHAALACDTIDGLSMNIKRLVASASVSDTQGVFDAIAILSPAGLGGSVQYDARQQADTKLLPVMQFAAQRDHIAWQYANGFTDVLGFGNRSFLQTVQGGAGSRQELLERATVEIFLNFLCDVPDSHIVRKHGAYMADVVRDEARIKKEVYDSLDTNADRLTFLRQYDQELKIRSINPGTSADLTVATLFVSLLMTCGGI